jgi:hypothetical protein
MRSRRQIAGVGAGALGLGWGYVQLRARDWLYVPGMGAAKSAAAGPAALYQCKLLREQMLCWGIPVILNRAAVLMGHHFQLHMNGFWATEHLEGLAGALPRCPDTAALFWYITWLTED